MVIRESGGAQLEELRIALEASGDQTFLRAGDAETPFKVPFSQDDVARALEGAYDRGQSIDPLVTLGSTLFRALFLGKAGRNLWERMSEADHQNRGLRLRIVTSLERTQHIPWELLFDPSRSDFMSLSGRLALVRTRPDGYAWESAQPPLDRLRILAVEADVSGDMRTAEDFLILRSLAKDNPERISLELIERATAQSLRTMLMYPGMYDVFHFAGTGEVLDHSKRGGLRQALRLLGPEPLFDRQELGDLLKRAGIRLAVLNACHSDWIARSLAKYVPAAVGLSASLDVESCLTMCRSFYQSVTAGSGLDLAVTASRQAVDRRSPGRGEWCKIVFYLQQPNGVLLRERDRSFAVTADSPQDDKHRVKLRRLIEIHQQNLEALERSAAAAPRLETVADQTVELKKKIQELREQLKLSQ